MTKKNKNKFYVVWRGRKSGIFKDWEACRKQISGYRNAKYKSFKSLEQAQSAFKRKSREFIGKEDYEAGLLTEEDLKKSGKPVMNSISVDAACRNNPGILEYRAVDTKTKREIFRKGPYQEGTINIGEFLAIVDGLRYLKQRKKDIPIYSDSDTAIKWVKDKKVNTQLKKTFGNRELFVLIDKALDFLEVTDYTNKILNWHTSAWGEIPADFGRK